MFSGFAGTKRNVLTDVAGSGTAVSELVAVPGDSVSAAADLVAGLVIGSRLRDAGVRVTASD